MLGPEDWQVVFALPAEQVYSMTASGDGTLFVASFEGSIFRGRADDPKSWERIVPAGTAPQHLNLFAGSRSTVFGLNGPNVYRWDEGDVLRKESTPITDSVYWCGDTTCGPRLRGGWARNADDVYVVTDDAVVLHFGGVTWGVLPGTPAANAPSSCPRLGEVLINEAVGGDESEVYIGIYRGAAGAGLARGATTGCWSISMLPVDASGARSTINGLISTTGGPVLATQYYQEGRTTDHPWRFFRFERGTWRLLGTLGVPRAIDWFFSSAQAGGVPVFWSFDGDLAVVEGERIEHVLTKELGQLTGAVGTSDAIVLAVRRREGGVVLLRER